MVVGNDEDSDASYSEKALQDSNLSRGETTTEPKRHRPRGNQMNSFLLYSIRWLLKFRHTQINNNHLG